MRYLGGKSRIAKQLMAVMRPHILARQAYVEPFVGGASMMAASPVVPVRIASDANAALITLWRRLLDGWVPPGELTPDKYAELRMKQDSGDPLTAFAGFGCSFGGKWFSGYARDSRGDNYAAQTTRALQRKAANLRGVIWTTGDYATCPLPEKSVVYCDPPYEGTTEYEGVSTFDHGRFWDWCIKAHKQGHAVFISEYSAPPSFRPVLEVATTLEMRSKEGREVRTERLFVPFEADYPERLCGV